MKILIAEDEMVSRIKMSKMMEKVGTTNVFDNGKDALASFIKNHESSNPFQLVILDVSMPNMTGIEVLKKIRAYENNVGIIKADQTTILMLTSYADKQTVISCFRAGCSDYMVKPFKMDVISGKLSKFGFNFEVTDEDKIRKNMSQMVSDAIEGFKQGSVELPSLPYIVQELQDFMEKPNASSIDMAKVIENDIAISIKLISTANAPFYKGFEKTKDVKMAIYRLGSDTTRGIVSAIANQGLYSTKNQLVQVTMDKLWLHALATAHCAKMIAEKIAFPHPGKLFVKGLIHDVGATILIKNIGDATAKDTALNQEELISSIFEVHGNFGAALLKKWNFGNDFVEVARLHEWTRFDKTTPKEVLIVNLADVLSFKTGYGFFDKEVPDVEYTQSAKLLGLKLNDLEAIADTVTIIVANSSGSFT